MILQHNSSGTGSPWRLKSTGLAYENSLTFGPDKRSSCGVLWLWNRCRRMPIVFFYLWSDFWCSLMVHVIRNDRGQSMTLTKWMRRWGCGYFDILTSGGVLDPRSIRLSLAHQASFLVNTLMPSFNGLCYRANIRVTCTINIRVTSVSAHVNESFKSRKRNNLQWIRKLSSKTFSLFRCRNTRRAYGAFLVLPPAVRKLAPEGFQWN